MNSFTARLPAWRELVAGFGETPSIAEMLDVAQALDIFGIDQICRNTGAASATRKNEADRQRLLMRDGFATLVADSSVSVGTAKSCCALIQKG